MMKHEFEMIAGYEVTEDDYNNIINPMYNATNLDKDEFVKCVDRKRFEYIPVKSKERIELENKINREILSLKNGIDYCNKEIERYKELLWVETDAEWIETWNHYIEVQKIEIREYKGRIKSLKWVLE